MVDGDGSSSRSNTAAARRAGPEPLWVRRLTIYRLLAMLLLV